MVAGICPVASILWQCDVFIPSLADVQLNSVYKYIYIYIVIKIIMLSTESSNLVPGLLPSFFFFFLSSQEKPEPGNETV